MSVGMRPSRSLRALAASVPFLVLAVACGGGSSGVNVVDDAVDARDAAAPADVPADTPAPPDVPAGPDAGGCPAGYTVCVACTDDEICKGAFGELGACDDPQCGDDGWCFLGALAVDTPCGVVDECHEEGTCQDVGGAVECVAGAAISCDDDDVCTTDTCDPAAGCQYAPSGEPGCCVEDADCDDEDVCTGAETCVDTACVAGEALDCDDQNPCTADSCDAATGCANAFVAGPGCCTVDADCDDANDCTTETCGAGGVCAYTDRIGACDDGDPCTTGDRCVDGACTPTAAAGSCGVLCELSGAEGEAVECPLDLLRRDEAGSPAVALALELDWDPAVATLETLFDRVCLVPGVCTDVLIPTATSTLFRAGHAVYLAPELPADWDGAVGVQVLHLVQPETPITDAWVIEGAADYTAGGTPRVVTLRFVLAQDVPADAPLVVLASGVVAEDADGGPLATAVTHLGIVTAADGCGGGTTLCFDAWTCTDDVCDAGAETCTFPADDAACDDGNECTLGDQCQAGRCVAGSFAADGTECAGADLCTERGACDGAGACVYDPADAVQCPAAPDDCSVYVCDPGTGECGITPLGQGSLCDDEDACTGPDTCSAAGECRGPAVDCDDDNACTADACDPATGCTHDPDDGACDDGDVCTADLCDPDDGCTNEPADGVECNDEDPCTLDDTCLDGECGGTWDGALCGCTVDGDCAALNDEDVCTGEYVCVAGACEIDPTTVITCPASEDACRIWRCDSAAGGCVPDDAPEGTLCTAGSPLCVSDAACDGEGECVGTAVDCEEGDVCTYDRCDALLGCVHEDIPDCEPIFDVCLLFGEAGEEIICPLYLVRQSADLTPPSGADFDLSWDVTRADFLSLRDEFCLGAFCAPSTLPICTDGETECRWGSLYPSGHVILAVPQDLAGWQEQGKLLLFHPSDPFRPLTEAVLGPDGEIDPAAAQYLAVRFVLLEDVAEADPVVLRLSTVSFSIATGQSYRARLAVTAAGRAIVVYALRPDAR